MSNYAKRCSFSVGRVLPRHDRVMSAPSESLAQRIIAKIFADHFKPGMVEVAFQREELVAAAEALGEPRPKNLGDIIYSLRYRVPLPDSVREAAPPADALSVIQVWQDFRVAEQKFPDLLARPIAAQFMANNEIALFEFEETGDRITIAREQHYELVAPDQLTAEELKSYRQSASHNP